MDTKSMVNSLPLVPKMSARAEDWITRQQAAKTTRKRKETRRTTQNCVCDCSPPGKLKTLRGAETPRLLPGRLAGTDKCRKDAHLHGMANFCSPLLEGRGALGGQPPLEKRTEKFRSLFSLRNLRCFSF